MEKTELEEKQLDHVNGGNSNDFQPIKIDFDSCIGCGNCADQCPCNAIRMVDNTPVIVVSNCVLCAVCCDVCPNKAIKID